MKGILVNNFYLIKSDLKLNILISIIFIATFMISKNNLMLLLAMLFILIVIPGTTFIIERKSETSKWYLIENKMPIKRETIIFSRYVSFFITSMISIAAMMLLVEVIKFSKNDALVNIIGFKNMTIGETIKLYIIMGQLMCIIYYPIMYLIGPQKSDAILILSIIITIPAMRILENSGNITTCIVMIILYICSYISACFIKFKSDEKQER